MPTKQKQKRPKKKNYMKHSERGKEAEKLQTDIASTEDSAAGITTSVENQDVPTLDKNADSISKRIDALVIDPSTQVLDKNSIYFFIRTAATKAPFVPTLEKNADFTYKDVSTVESFSSLTLDNTDSMSKDIVPRVEVSSATFLDGKTDSFANTALVKTLSVPTLDNANATCIGLAASVEVPSAPILCKNVDSVPLKNAKITTTTENPKYTPKSLKRLSLNNNKFMEKFNPATSSRETRKINTQIRNSRIARSQPGALYDEHGIHIASGKDICDCLFPNCSGCFYECPKCKSTKCAFECRVFRKFVYDQVDFEGTQLSFKFEDLIKD